MLGIYNTDAGILVAKVTHTAHNTTSLSGIVREALQMYIQVTEITNECFPILIMVMADRETVVCWKILAASHVTATHDYFCSLFMLFCSF